MSPVPMAETGDGPRPDPTTFTRRASDRPGADRPAADRPAADRPATDRFAADAAAE